MLKVNDINVYYGQIHALYDVSFDVNDGEIVTLIGANGAGKSTLMTTLFGTPRASSGRILLEGEDITALPPHRIALIALFPIALYRLAMRPET